MQQSVILSTTQSLLQIFYVYCIELMFILPRSFRLYRILILPDKYLLSLPVGSFISKELPHSTTCLRTSYWRDLLYVFVNNQS